MPPGGGGRARHGSAEAIHSRPTGAAQPRGARSDRSAATIEAVHVTRPEPLEGRRADRADRSHLRSLHTPGKPIANLTASLAGFGHDVLRERVRSGAATARARGQGFGRRPDYRPPDRRAPGVILPSEVDEQAAHEFLAELYSILSAEAEDCIRHEKYTMEWSQSGEHLRAAGR
jgi:hypothetical protein